MSRPLDTAAALDPHRSVVVEACAGSGKTWLLVSRMLRLLLAGAKPSELLAITFTRKAAQEMTDRLYVWLQTLALGSDAEVREFLRERKVAENEIDALLPVARGLLEAVLTATPGPTVTTFHGWFLDLLKRAPLEAGLPWGAPLLEREKLLQREVLDQLAAKWAAQPASAYGIALTALLNDYGQNNLETLLFHFLQRRAEWWAYTQEQTEPVTYALEQLRGCLQFDPDSDPLAAFWADELMVARVKRVGHALEKGSKTERERAPEILQSPTLEAEAAHATLMRYLLTAGARRKTQATKELQKNLGAELDTYLRDLNTVEGELEKISEHLAEIRTWQLNQHGLLLGHALLAGYQEAKAQQGVIDFVDAEWLACRLLASEEHAPGLALKLDARYRHLLLDEFQDTNPLQWQALSTWLSEARAADADMTVFMVGDPKQAIYRFRRGEARVFDAAGDFLQQHFGALRLANNMTRRLAPDVVKAINPVFASEAGFEAHTHAEENQSLPGAVRCLAVTAPENNGAEATNNLRNPLDKALPEAADRAVHEEAREFARVLKHDILGKWAIREDKADRAARFGDVMALVRKRTHLQLYERALEAAGIPFITSRRGGLLHALEAQDMIALLETLVMPHADLKLAHALKSPIFGCSDDELLQIFNPDGPPGWDALNALPALTDPRRPPALVRAARLLNNWRTHVGTLPVHDLLDRIYFEGDVEARYAAAVPAAMRPQVSANLRAFMQLALTQDAGRYPTLAGFIRELKNLVDDTDAAPGEGVAAEGENAVRLLTIHGAKGLEAPIVWLLGGSDHSKGDSHDVLAPWPPTESRPQHFSLFGKKEDRGAFRQAWFEEEETLAEREDTNLLYVALTRAQQALVVSGDAAKNAWLSRVAEAWQDGGHPADLPVSAKAETSPPAAMPPRIHAPAVGQRTSPAPTSEAAAAGELFHACLECHAPPGAARDLPALAARLGISAAELSKTEHAVQTLLALPELRRLFDPAQYLRARNELAFIDSAGRVQRIDRLVEFEDEIWVLDYKTGATDTASDEAALAISHGAQLQAYAGAVEALLPGKPVRAGIVLASGRLVTLSGRAA